VEAPTHCERCNDPLPARKPGDRKFRRFCSKRCASGCHKERTFTCQHCGQTWEAWSRQGQPPRYCSEACRRRAAKLRTDAWKLANPERATVNRATAWSNWAKANPDKVRAKNAAKYARDRGSLEAEHFTLDEIHERDQGWCYLCQQDCPRAEASMDHVIPTCAPHHGPHTRANVKLAHLGCNSRKGRRLLSELSWYTPTI